MSTALLVGQDEMLQLTRAALLRTLGVETVCCWGPEALDMLRDRQFDLVVLCHSLPRELSMSLAEKIHANWPDTLILRITMHAWDVDDDGKLGDVVSSGEPEKLILHAKSLLLRTRPSAARAVRNNERMSA